MLNLSSIDLDWLKVEYPKRKSIDSEKVTSEVDEADLYDDPVGVNEAYNDESPAE
jgi:hypothetical protein